MEETERLSLPTHISVAGAEDLRVTPNELRMLKAVTGKTMTDLMGEEADDADRMQAVVWLELRRRGYTPAWEDAGDVAISFTGETPPSDPTRTNTLPDSPRSADSGG
jgi:hypothetical protein